MKTKWSFSLLFALVLGLSSCTDRLIGDAEERETVRQDFAARKTALNNEALFSGLRTRFELQGTRSVDFSIRLYAPG